MKKYIILFILSFMICSVPMSSLAAEKSTATAKESTEESAEESSEEILTGLQKIDGKYYYFDESGNKETGWKKIEDKIYCFKEKSGVAYTGRVKIDEKYYYFSSKGVLKTGFQKIDGKRYYFQEKGKLGVIGSSLKGLNEINGKYYYFKDSGEIFASGWKKIEDKIYYFQKKGNIGVAYTGRVEISGKYYYFNSKGVLKTGFQKIDGKRYYFQEKGKLGVIGSSLKGLNEINGKYYYFKASGEVVTGTKKIDKKWYFFNKKGVRQSKTVKEDGVTYYINSKGCLEAYKDGKNYYKPNGKEMTKYEKDDYTTLQTARSIVSEITTSKMTKKQKLKVCFAWVMKKPYVMRRKFTGAKGWPALYANDHFKRGGGDCHADASALAYLARAIGYTDVYVCIDANDYRIARSHSWAQINGYVYDPLFAQSKSYSKYYGAIKKYAMGKERVAVGYE
jgi:glucan-binding YG repeat protein